MRMISLLETLEGRRMLSGSTPRGVVWPAPAVVAPVNVIGDTGGVYASALTPGFSGVTSPEKLKSARRDLTITLAVDGTGGAVNTNSLYESAVALYEVDADGNRIAKVQTGNPQTSGGGDTLSVTPDVALKANTSYQFEVNVPGVSYNPNNYRIRNTEGTAFPSTKVVFRTNTEIAIANPNINFSQQDAQAGSTKPFTATTIGPDRKLYAATLEGEIYRWTIDSDGTLSNRQVITTIQTAYGANRIITGITFAPDATAGDLRLYVSHGQYRFGTSGRAGTTSNDYADDYSGAITLLTGASLQTRTDLIVNIPRSAKDHMNNQIAFDPAGNNFFFVIPSMSAMGRADAVWGSRAETALTAAMVRVNIAKMNNELANTGPIDLDGNAGYDATDTANALNLYATGIRNAYDMVFHSNGRLYTATNGSSAGGNTPAGGGAVALTNVPQTEQDKLLEVTQGKYYGHPNPVRGEYVLDGGNPTSGVDPYEFAVNDKYGSGRLYPVGTQPDPDFELPVLDMQKNASPDGMIEYKSNSFGGLLKGYMLIARYNGGSDIFAVKPNSNGTISKNNIQVRITGFSGLNAPLDLVEDTTNGNIYTVQLNEKAKTGSIVLLKPKAIDVQGAAVTSNPVPYRASFYVAPGNRKGAVIDAQLVNNGTTTMVLDVSATKITRNRGNFVVLNLPEEDLYILPGESYTFRVRGVLARGQATPVYGNVAFATNETANRYTVLQLRAFSLFGNNASSASSGVTPQSLVTSSMSATAKSSPFAGSATPSNGASAADKSDASWWLEDVVA